MAVDQVASFSRRIDGAFHPSIPAGVIDEVGKLLLMAPDMRYARAVKGRRRGGATGAIAASHTRETPLVDIQNPPPGTRSLQ
jgi:hypothetical protein